MNALASCAVEANNPAESSDFARGVRQVIRDLASAAYAGGNWGLSNQLMEIADSIDWRRLSGVPEHQVLADRLVRQEGTMLAEYTLSQALKRVCGIPEGTTVISQMWILGDGTGGDRQNTSMLAAHAAECRGEK